MFGLYSVTPANNDPSEVLERRSSNSLMGRMEKMHQPWSEVVREEGSVLGLEQQALSESSKWKTFTRLES